MENVRLKPVSDVAVFFQGLVGLVIAALVMLGVGGSVYHLLAPGGWLAEVFDRSLAGGLAAILAFIVIGACVWMTREWISVKTRNRYSELFVYAFAGAGALYLIEFMMKGGI